MNALTEWLDRRRDRKEAERVKPISMLSVETLAAIRRLAIQCGGPVIEIGTYIGGTSVLISRALSETKNGRLICVEAGGSHDHPTMPSRDIIGDWHKNISAERLAIKPTLIEGYAWRPATVDAIAAALGSDRARMVVSDADGFPGIGLIDVDYLLADDCIVVVDDYGGTSASSDVPMPLEPESHAFTSASVARSDAAIVVLRSSFLGRRLAARRTATRN
jgi:hypothetical protein